MADFELREARLEDVDAISVWTQNTFSWGDYIADAMPRWLGESNSNVVVCTVEEEPVAVARALMLSGTEGWLEGARVHPDFRRSGMGRAMNGAGVEWVRQQGGQVARLATDEDNRAAVTQVGKLGYRKTSSWMYTKFEVQRTQVASERHRLTPAGPADLDAAWMSWSSGELHAAGRGLIAKGWRWRKARPEDLTDADPPGGFFSSMNGWATVMLREPDWMQVNWFETQQHLAPGLVEGLLTRAREEGADRLTLQSPNVDWMNETLRRAAGTTKEVFVFSLSL